MKRPSQRRGTSLVELFIATSLALTLLGLISMALSKGTRYYQRLLDAGELEERCMAVVELMSNELTESSLTGIHCAPDGIVFPCPRDEDGRLQNDPVNGQLRWPLLVCYYFDSTEKTLTRYFEVQANDSNPVDFTALHPSQGPSYFLSSGVSARQMCGDVNTFAVEFVQEDGSDADDKPDPTVRNRAEFLTLRLVLEQVGERTTTIEVTSHVSTKNTN